MIPSQGTLFYWSDETDQVSDSPAALPTTFPLAGADLDDWTPFECIEEVDGIDDDSVETVEHRCLNSPAGFVEEFPTGFLKAEKLTMTATYDPDEHVEFRAGKSSRKKYRILIAFPLDEDQTTTPERFAYRVYCTKAKPMVDQGGQPIKQEFEFTKFGDIGVHNEGS